MPPLRARLLAALKARHAMVGSLLTLAMKSTGAVLMMLIFIVAARSVPQTDFGRLAVAFNALSLLSSWAQFGQETLFVRSWGEYYGRDDALAHGAYWFGWRILACGVGCACLAVLGMAALGPWRFSSSEVLAGCAFLLAQAALNYSSNTCRHIVNFVVSELNREVLWRLVLLGVMLALLNVGLAPAQFFWAASAGMLLAIAVESVVLIRRFPRAVLRAPMRMRVSDWLRRSRSMAASACIESSTQYAEVLLLGLLVSPAQAAAYFVAARVANIFAMLTTGLHTYTVSYAANLFFSRQTERLQSIMRSVMLVALCITTPIVTLIVCAGARILGLFGPDFAQETATLLILAGACYTATLAGPAGGLMQITGHEKLYSRVIFCALVLRVGLLFWLAPRYGALGAAIGWAAVNGPVAVGLSVACRRLCGIDPSALSIVSRRREVARAAAADPAQTGA